MTHNQQVRHALRLIDRETRDPRGFPGFSVEQLEHHLFGHVGRLFVEKGLLTAASECSEDLLEERFFFAGIFTDVDSSIRSMVRLVLQSLSECDEKFRKVTFLGRIKAPVAPLRDKTVPDLMYYEVRVLMDTIFAGGFRLNRAEQIRSGIPEMEDFMLYLSEEHELPIVEEEACGSQAVGTYHWLAEPLSRQQIHQ